jgi:ERCC4-type nuclease
VSLASFAIHGDGSLLVSPAEPERLRAIGTVSSRPEKYGADFMFFAHKQWVGIQRKEISDLIASLADGRLAREVAQMQSLDQRMLIVEGPIRFTNDGEMMDRPFGQKLTKKQWKGLLWSIRLKDIWVEFSESVDDTIEILSWFEEWIRRDKHQSLERRPGPLSMWGNPTNEDYQRHLLMGLPGVGPELAERLRAKFGGVPWQWTINYEDLLNVDGIGAKKARSIYDSLA